MGISYADAVKAFQNASAASATNVPAVEFAKNWQSNNLDPVAASALIKIDQALAGTVPGLTVTSAFRPAGPAEPYGGPPGFTNYNKQVQGATDSQHIYGKAIDLDLSSFTPAQRQAVLNAVMAQPEIKGIGVYDKNLNTLHFDTRAGDRVAWGPDYTTKSLGSVLNGFTQPMLTGWLNGSTPSATTQVASVSPPPPNLRETALAFQGANPYDIAPQPRLSPAAQAASQLAQGGGGSPAPQRPPAPTQTASSWLPPSLQQGGSGFVDNLGGGMSPLHQFRVAESSDVPAGPFGADALVKAAMSGDAAGVKQAMNAITGAAIGAILGGQGSKDQITAQINDYLAGLAKSAPGAARAIQVAAAANPQLFSALAPDQQAQVKAALAALPPQATGQVAMPNLRPPMPQGTPAPAPLVAQGQPDVTPKMASFSPPPSAGNFGASLDPTQLGTLQSAITAGGADSWMPGVARSLSNLVTSPGSQEAPFVPPDGQYADYWKGKMFNSPNAPGMDQSKPTAYRDQFGEWSVPDTNDAQGNWSPDQLQQLFQPPPSASGGNLDVPTAVTPASVPVPSAASLNPTQMRGLEGPSTQGKINYAPLMPPGMPNFGLPPTPFDPNAYDPLADASIFNKMLPGQPKATAFGAPLLPAPPKTVQIGALPKPQPRPVSAAPFGVPPPAAMSPQAAFQAQYGPAPQNVNWAATLAPDPFSQAAPGTYVLQDFGSRGPPQNALQEAFYNQGGDDSYLQYGGFNAGGTN